MIVIDTWRWDTLSGAGGFEGQVPMPVLENWPDAGTFKFTNAFASSSWTLPSIASLLTGQYPSHHQAWGAPREAAPLNSAVPTLAETLQAAGYETAAVVNNAFLDPSFGLSRGFAHYNAAEAKNSAHRRAEPAIQAADEIVRSTSLEQPLFLFLHLFDPHLSYNPLAPWDSMFTGPDPQFEGHVDPIVEIRAGEFDPQPDYVAYMKALYLGEVAYVDAQLATFLDLLAQRGRSRESLVIITSDHGEEFGEHGGWEHGHTMHQELTRVPLMLRRPASAPDVPTELLTRPVSLVDIFPTVLAAVGLPMPENLPGRSLFDSAADRREGVLSERAHLDPSAYSYRTPEWSLVIGQSWPGGRLYRAADRGETSELSVEYPEVVTRLRAEAESLQQSLVAESPGRASRAVSEEVEEQLESLGYIEQE